MSDTLRAAARSIFAQALQASNVREAVQTHLAAMPHNAAVTRWIVIAMGKAAVPMYAAAAEVLKLPTEAIVVAPPETLPKTPGAPRLASETWGPSTPIYIPGAHPTPTEDSLRAADEMMRLLATADDETAVLYLISGGASAMVERPLNPAISLADLATFNRALVGSGMAITQMNTLRKHFSAIKGGRLAQCAAAARVQHTLLISDVPANPDAIASGPSLPDSTTVADCKPLFAQLQQVAELPQSVIDFFTDSQLPETPKATEPAFARAQAHVILSGDHLACDAAFAAQDAGFHTVIDNRCDDWEYRDAARHLLDHAAARVETYERVCIVSVGEVGVQIGADYGEGGRNQQFAVWCAQHLAASGVSATVLSAGSDGVDGHSSAAGAVCDETTVARAASLGLSAEQALDHFNTAPLLRAVGDAIVTGPTGNNLRDLRLVLMEQ